jgi:lysophospholipase L1-like esterase
MDRLPGPVCVPLSRPFVTMDDAMKLRIAVLLTLAAAGLAGAQSRWVVDWGASPAPQLPTPAEMQHDKLVFSNQTLREIVHTSVATHEIRVRLSNAYGKTWLQVGGAHIALRAEDAAIVPGSDHALTFSGRAAVTIPPDALVLSDPVKLDVPAGSDLAVSIFVPGEATGAGIHYFAAQTSYVASGDLAAAASLSEPKQISAWVFLTGVDALEPASASTIVAFGDSITDGARSTENANDRWPDFLARRLAAAHKRFGVLDAGIGGNRVLNDPASNIRFGTSALARFDRDVLAQPGVKYLLILEGINDIGHAEPSSPPEEKVSADDIIAGLKQLIERAHEKGIKVYGCTLTPFEGTTYPGYFSPEKEVQRKAVNRWIRAGGAFDAVIDFDKAVRDPSHPDRMLPKYDGGDHLHPGDAGYKEIGAAINLSLFR